MNINPNSNWKVFIYWEKICFPLPVDTGKGAYKKRSLRRGIRPKRYVPFSASMSPAPKVTYRIEVIFLMAIFINFVAPDPWLLAFLNDGPLWKPNETWGSSPPKHEYKTSSGSSRTHWSTLKWAQIQRGRYLFPSLMNWAHDRRRWSFFHVSYGCVLFHFHAGLYSHLVHNLNHSLLSGL